MSYNSLFDTLICKESLEIHAFEAQKINFFPTYKVTRVFITYKDKIRLRFSFVFSSWILYGF